MSGMMVKYFKLPLGYEVQLHREIGRRRVVVPSSRWGRAAAFFRATFIFILWESLRFMAIALVLSLLLHTFGQRPAKAAETTIPRAALPHKAALIRAAHAELGLDAPVALLAAQIHTESLWRANAVSGAGARGLAQFMPATANWLPKVAPQTGKPNPFNPGWSLRALCAYDAYLLLQVRHAASARDHWAFVLSGYNGGLGWVQRDRALAASLGRDPARYWGSVEHVNAGRKPSAFRENKEYPRRIFAIQSVYERAGWGPAVQ